MKTLHSEDDLNRSAHIIRLFHYSRLALAAVIVGGLLLTVVLWRGAANPPRAGGTLTRGTDSSLHLSAGDAPTVLATIPIPAPPYTLEFTARVTGGNGIDPAWGIMLDNGPFEVRVYRERYFAVFPTLPDTTAFIHIRAAGQINALYLAVRGDGSGTLRINEEIAWQGLVPAGKTIRLIGRGGATGGDLSLMDIRLYTPGS